MAHETGVLQQIYCTDTSSNLLHCNQPSLVVPYKSLLCRRVSDCIATSHRSNCMQTSHAILTYSYLRHCSGIAHHTVSSVIPVFVNTGTCNLLHEYTLIHSLHPQRCIAYKQQTESQFGIQSTSVVPIYLHWGP